MDNQPVAPQPAMAPQPVLATPAPANDLGVPPEWKGGFDVYKYSREAVKFNLTTIVRLFAISILLNIITRFVPNDGSAVSLVLSLVLALAAVPVEIGIILATIAAVRRTKVEVGSVLSQSLSFFVKYVLLYILLGLIAFGTLVLFIVPFFIVFPRLVLAPYFLIDQKMGVVDSIQASWEHTKGHLGKVWGIIGVYLLFAVLCLVLVGIYFIFMYQAAWAILYVYITNRAAPAAVPQPVAAQPIAPVAPPPAVAPAEPQAPAAPEAPAPTPTVSPEPPVNPPAPQQ